MEFSSRKLSVEVPPEEGGQEHEDGAVAAGGDDDERGGKTKPGSSVCAAVRTYTLRGLFDESEVKEWAEFCASVFSYKPNPPLPSYFERHYRNDPQAKPSHVRVAVCDDCGGGTATGPGQRIVASCRIFVRRISDGRGGTIKAGGIGEVCTSPHHRRRGLSKELLKDCISIMEERQRRQRDSGDSNDNFQVSFLHAAPQFFPVYRSAGYECVTTEWTSVKVDLPSLAALIGGGNGDDKSENNGGGIATIRLAEFPKDAPSLAGLHRRFSESRFAGCVVRSERYWSQYLSRELDGALWVAEAETAPDEGGGGGSSSTRLLAWMSVRERGPGKFQLREFGWDQDGSGDCTRTIRPPVGPYGLFAVLLRRCIVGREVSTERVQELQAGEVRVAVPKFVFNMLQDDYKEKSRDQTPSCLEWASAVSEDDRGWMYKALQDGAAIPTGGGCCGDDDGDGDGDRRPPHLIWPSDSF